MWLSNEQLNSDIRSLMINPKTTRITMEAERLRNILEELQLSRAYIKALEDWEADPSGNGKDNFAKTRSTYDAARKQQ